MSDEQSISAMLAMKTVAVVGLSDQPDRASHGVAEYLQSEGYRIVPINPNRAAQRILGELCYPSLTSAAVALAASGSRIEWVDVFRRSPDVPPVVSEAIAIGAKGVWLQLGIRNDEAVEMARLAGLLVVQDRCSRIESIRRGIE